VNRLPFLSPPPLTLGTSGPWFFPRPFSLSLKDLSVHSQVTGISGSGKSTFLTRLCLALFQAGQPFTLIDPHADLAKAVLSHLLTRGVYRNPAAFDRILYLDLPAAARRSLYLPFNPFVHTKENLSHETIAANFKEAMYR
jgi:type IV secretory pathway VirB4 component